VRVDLNLNVDISGFSVFADYFFDGLIADWVVQSKINQALDAAESQHDKIMSVMEGLDETLADITAAQEKLRRDRRQMLERI